MAELQIKLVNGELAGKTMQEINKQVRDAAVSLSKAKVGTDEFVKATQKLEQSKQLQADMKKQVDATAKASDTLKQSFGGILNKIPGFSQLSSVLTQVRGSVGGLTSGFGLLKGALIAIPIFALVTAITALVGWFSKTEAGANMVSGAFKGIGSVIDVVMSRIWNLGDTIKQLFSDPIAFFKNLGNDMVKAAKDGYDLVQLFDDIEDRQRDLAVKSKEQDIQIDRLMLQAKNVSLTYNQKIALLTKADEITRASYKAQLALSNDYLKAVEKEVAMAEKSGTMGDDLADKLKDAKLDYLDLISQEIGIEEKIQNRRDQIIVKQEAKAAREVEIEESKIKKIEEVNEVHEQKKEAKIEDDLQKKLAQAELDLITDQNILNESLFAKELTEEQYAFQSGEKLLNYHNTRLALIKEKLGEESLEYQQEYAKVLELQKSSAAESIAVTEWMQTDGGKALMGSLSVFGNAFNQIAAMHEQGSASWKTFAIAAATISAIQGAINAYASTAAIPVVGAALAPIAAGVALAAGMFNVAKIKSVKQPAPTKKMATGGMIDGPSHAGGGVDIVNAEGGEFIFSRKAVRSIGANVLESINRRLTFATGGMVPKNPFEVARGSVVANPVGGSSESRNLLDAFNQMKTSFDFLAADISSWPKILKVHNNLQETEKGLATLNKLREEWDV
jgi:hypothetical protein